MAFTLDRDILFNKPEEEGCYDHNGLLPHLSHLLDLGASLPDEGSTLAGRHHQPQGDRRLARGRAVAHRVDDVLAETNSRYKPFSSEYIKLNKYIIAHNKLHFLLEKCIQNKSNFQ